MKKSGVFERWLDFAISISSLALVWVVVALVALVLLSCAGPPDALANPHSALARCEEIGDHVWWCAR